MYVSCAMSRASSGEMVVGWLGMLGIPVSAQADDRLG